MCSAESSLSQNLLFLRNMCQTPLAQEKHTSGKADYAIVMSQVWFRPAKRNTCWVYRLTPVLMAIRNLDKQGSPGSTRFWTTTPTTHSAEGNSQQWHFKLPLYFSLPFLFRTTTFSLRSRHKHVSLFCLAPIAWSLQGAAAIPSSATTCALSIAGTPGMEMPSPCIAKTVSVAQCRLRDNTYSQPKPVYVKCVKCFPHLNSFCFFFFFF